MWMSSFIDISVIWPQSTTYKLIYFIVSSICRFVIVHMKNFWWNFFVHQIHLLVPACLNVLYVLYLEASAIKFYSKNNGSILQWSVTSYYYIALNGVWRSSSSMSDSYCYADTDRTSVFLIILVSRTWPISIADSPVLQLFIHHYTSSPWENRDKWREGVQCGCP